MNWFLSDVWFECLKTEKQTMPIRLTPKTATDSGHPGSCFHGKTPSVVDLGVKHETNNIDGSLRIMRFLTISDDRLTHIRENIDNRSLCPEFDLIYLNCFQEAKRFLDACGNS